MPPSEYIGSPEQHFWAGFGLLALAIYAVVRCVCGVRSENVSEVTEDSDNDDSDDDGENAG